MNRIGIYTNLKKDKGLLVTQSVMAALAEHSIEPLLTQEAAELLRADGYATEDLVMNSDAVIILGGDGTVLNIASHAMRYSVPMLAVNLGRMGFLTQIEQSGIKEGVKALAEGRYSIEERMMLKVSKAEEQRYALNEAAVLRARPQNTVRLRVRVNGCIMDEFAGDGVLVASPTGSTAYSLSAGGPILSPCMQAMIITPVCAHTMLSRPAVVQGDEIITIELIQGKVYTSIDGKEWPQSADSITVEKASEPARFVRLYERNFYGMLKDRFSDLA